MTNQYKVVKIISPFQVVINAGLEQELKKGQRIQIYAIGEMIYDLETNDELEQLEIIRGTGKIIHVQNKISTIESDMMEETPRTIKRNKSMSAIAAAFGGGDTEVTELSREAKSFDHVQLGDLARPIWTR